MDTMSIIKMIGSSIIGSVGFFILYRGKKTMDTDKMIWGGVLIVLSYFLFS